MSFSDFLGFLFLLGVLAALFMLASSTPCGVVLMPLLILMSLGMVVSFFATQTPPSPTAFTIWNRSGYTHSKSGWKVTSYRKPNMHLSSGDYMMGVEMAKSNSCHSFDFGKQDSIALFRRCAHFFPELYAEYARDHQARVGVAL
jgi:hypothetical protein